MSLSGSYIMQSAGPGQHPVLLELKGQMATVDTYPTSSTVYVINVTLTEVLELKRKLHCCASWFCPVGKGPHPCMPTSTLGLKRQTFRSFPPLSGRSQN